MNKTYNHFFTPWRMVFFSILFAIVLNLLSLWIARKLKEDYNLAQANPPVMETYDANLYYHYLKYFGSKEVRYKSDKTLYYDSKEKELEFYRTSLEDWEAALDELVVEISTKMSTEERKIFESSQKVWNDSILKLSEEGAASITDSKERTMRYMELQIDFVRARAYELLKNYKHIFDDGLIDNK